MADDYGTMKARIADELMAGGRSDLSTQVATAIQTAIRHYRQSKFWFNRGVLTNTTTADQVTADAPDGMLAPEIVRVDTGSGFFELTKKSYSVLTQYRGGNQALGRPYLFAEYEGLYYLWQTPDDDYDLEWSGLIDLLVTEPLVADASTNAWMVEGEALIRQRARAVVQIDTLKDPDAKAEAMQLRQMGGLSRSCLSMLEADALSALRSESAKRSSTGRVRPG